MMKMICLGLSHQNTPISIREKFCLSDVQQDLVLSELRHNPSIVEAFVLSTCNRMEIYARVLDEVMDVEFILRTVCLVRNVELTAELRDYFYMYLNQKALRHLLAVVTGLDSLVIGEKQILGQVKSAIERARRKLMLGKAFNVLSNIVVRAGKKVRHETRIGDGGSSVSWAAVMMAEKALGNLEGKSILIIGAGKMSLLAANQLKNRQVGRIYVMNRTTAHAQEMADRVEGTVVPFCDIKKILTQVDVCICSSGAPHYILDISTMQGRHMDEVVKPLVLLDIAVPRNVDPAVGAIDGVELLTIDDLIAVTDGSMAQRSQAIPHVEVIIEAKLAEITRKLSKLETLDASVSHSLFMVH